MFLVGTAMGWIAVVIGLAALIGHLWLFLHPAQAWRLQVRFLQKGKDGQCVRRPKGWRRTHALRCVAGVLLSVVVLRGGLQELRGPQPPADASGQRVPVAPPPTPGSEVGRRIHERATR